MRRRRAPVDGVGEAVGVEVKLLLITDLSLAGPEETLRRARLVLARSREVMFGVRDHGASVRARLDLARALVSAGARVLLHDRVDIALAARAHGVHLAERSIAVADARTLVPYVSRSCHDEAGIAAARDADAITLSPLFASPGKGPALGVERFAALAASTTVPVYALGGITASNARLALAAGAAGVAAIRAWLVDDPLALLD